jgi:hypothetical protein
MILFQLDLGDNCIVFENFTASIGYLMVTNWVYLRPSNRQLMQWNFQIQYSYLHSNVIMCVDVYRCIIDKSRWRKRLIDKILKIPHAISTVEFIPWKLHHQINNWCREIFKYNTIISILM